MEHQAAVGAFLLPGSHLVPVYKLGVAWKQKFEKFRGASEAPLKVHIPCSMMVTGFLFRA